MSLNPRVDQIIEMLKAEPGYDPNGGVLWEAIKILESTQRGNEALGRALKNSVPLDFLPSDLRERFG